MKKKIIKIGSGVRIKETPSTYFNLSVYINVRQEKKKKRGPPPPKKKKNEAYSPKKINRLINKSSKKN